MILDVLPTTTATALDKTAVPKLTAAACKLDCRLVRLRSRVRFWLRRGRGTNTSEPPQACLGADWTPFLMKGQRADIRKRAAALALAALRSDQRGSFHWSLHGAIEAHREGTKNASSRAGRFFLLAVWPKSHAATSKGKKVRFKHLVIHQQCHPST
eukprot:5972210-Prymnesium_polylepis.2